MLVSRSTCPLDIIFNLGFVTLFVLPKERKVFSELYKLLLILGVYKRLYN